MRRLRFEFHHLRRTCTLTSIALLTLAPYLNLHIWHFQQLATHNSVAAECPLPPDFAQARAAKNPQPLKMTAEVLDQRYCVFDAKTFTVVFKVRMRFVNETSGKLIVEKTPGSSLYDIAVARDAKSLSEGKYEYHPNTDMMVQHFPPDTPEKFKSPGPEFAIIPPGQSLQYEREFFVPGLGTLHDSDETADSIRSGKHVVQFIVSTWDFQTAPQDIQKRWEQLGHLVYEEVSTGPLQFSLPTNPKLDKCK